MKRTIPTVAAAMLLTAPLKAAVVDEKLLAALSWAESRDNPNARGKSVELGRWQLRSSAICAVVYWRTSFGEHPSWDANDPTVASDHLQLCNIWFFKQTGRMPEPWELVVTHNAPQLFKRNKWTLSKMPLATRSLVSGTDVRSMKRTKTRSVVSCLNCLRVMRGKEKAR